jgi:hypothetical protein
MAPDDRNGAMFTLTATGNFEEWQKALYARALTKGPFTLGVRECRLGVPFSGQNST